MNFAIYHNMPGLWKNQQWLFFLQQITKTKDNRHMIKWVLTVDISWNSREQSKDRLIKNESWVQQPLCFSLMFCFHLLQCSKKAENIIITFNNTNICTILLSASRKHCTNYLLLYPTCPTQSCRQCPPLEMFFIALQMHLHMHMYVQYNFCIWLMPLERPEWKCLNT